MLEPKYGVLAQLNRVLEKPDSLSQLENCLWLIANVIGESADLCKLVLSST